MNQKPKNQTPTILSNLKIILSIFKYWKKKYDVTLITKNNRILTLKYAAENRQRRNS